MGLILVQFSLLIYDTVYNAAKPWRLLRVPTTVYTEAEGEVLGLTVGMTQIPDAFGVSRPIDKCALGPLWRPLGLSIFVR